MSETRDEFPDPPPKDGEPAEYIPPPPRVAESNYPRYFQPQQATTRLSWPIRLLRGFVIGNYWFAVFCVLALGAYMASGQHSSRRSRHEAYDPTALVVLVFFIAGFAIGSLTRRRKVSVWLAGLSGPPAWIIWGAVIIQMGSGPGFLLILPFTALCIAAAIIVNRVARAPDLGQP